VSRKASVIVLFARVRVGADVKCLPRQSSFLHNTSIGFFTRQSPSTAVKWSALLGFPIASYLSPVSMGLSFVYNQVAIALGQWSLASGSLDGFGGGGGYEWAKMMGLGAVATAAVVGLRYKQDNNRIL